MHTRSLIGLSLALAATTPLAALAQDWTPTGDRILSDPTFLPLQGQFYGETAYNWDQANTHDYDAAGANTADVRRTLSTIRQTFAFGITDDLSVHVTEAYGFSGQDRITTANGVTRIGESGWDDPSFGFTYRLMDQRSHPASFDVFADYSPDAFSDRTGTPTDNATIARGGAATDFGIALGRETRLFTIRGAVVANYFGGADYFNSNSGATVGTAGYWAPSLRLATQTRFTNRLSANVGADYTFNGSPVITDTADGLQHVNHLGDYEDVNVSLNYHFIPNTLVGSLRYAHTFHQNTSEIYPTDPTQNQFHTGSGDDVGVALQYVFK
jgi:hypothetical protein